MDNKYPIGTPDDLRPIDRAMLLALSHRQRDSTPLSMDQERLLDSWIAGRLPPIDADRAAELAKHNKFAAERVLERRLIAAANESPAVASVLSAQVLKASQPPRAGANGIFNLRWPTLSRWRWSGLGAIAAATVVIAVFSFQVWQARLLPDRSFQIAMVTIEDRSVLFEGARRTRGPIASNSVKARKPPKSVRRKTAKRTKATSRKQVTKAKSKRTLVKNVVPTVETVIVERLIPLTQVALDIVS
jgi:hypothetical protein